MLLITKALFASLVIALATTLSAQIADFTDHGNFGVYNPTQHAAGELGWQANQIENDRFVVSAWTQLPAGGGNAIFFWQAFDKVTGVLDGPNLLANASINPGPVNMTPSLTRRLRPGLCFSKAPSGNPVAYDGIVIAVPNQIGGAVDVNLHFLRIDPASLPPMANQPDWIVDPLRAVVNVSASAGVSDSANVACNDAGEIAVVWRDLSTAGMIGGQNAINPQQPNPNPGFLFAVDIYARRMDQQFDAANPVAGVIDANTPMASTKNLTSSFGQDSFPDLATNGDQSFYVVWQEFSAQSDNVGSIGANSGPIGGAFGAESTDIYGRSFTFPTTSNEVNLNVGQNITRSTGTSNLPPAIRYNETFNQLGVVFLDNTISGGIAGEALINAIPNGPIQAQTAVDDVFLALFSANFGQTKVTDVTQSPNPEMLGTLASMGTRGWALVWGESVSVTTVDIRSRLQTYDGVGQQQSAPRQYPIQSVVQGGNPQPVWPFALTAKNADSLCLSFTMAGMPDALKAGQPAAAAGQTDLFFAYGEPTNTGVVNGQVTIETFEVNDSQPIDPTAAPATVTLIIALKNSSFSQSVNLTDINVTAPAGFTSQGGPNLPATLNPAGTLNLNLIYDVDAGALLAGQNEFTISTTGTVNGNLTISSGETAVSVVGTTGGIAGVQVGYTINPPQIRVGETTSVSIMIAVTNGGLQSLDGISFEGALVPGLLPANLANLVLLPSPSTTTITAGATQVFTGTLLVGAALESQDYRPAFTMNSSQGVNTGAVTSQVTNPVQIVQGNDGQGSAPPPSGLVNGSAGGGCAISADTGFLAFLATILALIALVRVSWSRRRVA